MDKLRFKGKVKAAFMCLTLVMSAVMPAMVPATRAMAATGAAYVGSASGEAGDEVTVSITLYADTEIGGTYINLSYDPGSIEFVSGKDMSGGAGTISAVYSDTFSGSLNKSFTVKILKPGTSTISVLSSSYMVSMDGDKVQVSGGSGTITGNAPVTYSTDNNLASLSISPGTLSPAFSPNVTKYTSSVGADCAHLVVSAKANDSNATVSVSGTRMDPGNNTTTITVTAQSGDKKVYTIYTTKAEGETESSSENESEGETEVKEQVVKIDDAAYNISSDFEEHPLPSGYEAVDYEYNETTIKAGKGVNTKLILVYLESSDSNGKSGFYIYDSVAKTFTLYTEVAQPEVTYVILPITDSMEKPTGLALTDYNINGVTARVMMSSDRSYCVFYGISSTGKTGWFRYDCTDKTIQSYVEPVSHSVEVNNQATKQSVSVRMWKVVTAALAGVVLMLLIVIGVLASKVSKGKKAFAAAIDGYNGGSSGSLEDEDLDEIAYNDEEDDLLAEDETDVENEAYVEDVAEEIELFDVDEK